MSDIKKPAAAINDAVARITGMSKRLLTPIEEMKAPGSVTSAFGGVSMKTPKALTPEELKAPEHKMAPEDGEEMKSANKEIKYDDEGQPIETVKAEAIMGRAKKETKSGSWNPYTGKNEEIDVNFSANAYVASLGEPKVRKTTELLEHIGGEKKMVKSLLEATGVGSLSEWKNLAGLENLDEEAVADPRKGKSGDVPTNYADLDNKMKAGLPGLKGKSLQPIEPEEEDKDLVGDDEEMTLGDVMEALALEGISEDDLWGAFLEEKGLTLDLFSQLMSEAYESDDQAEIDQMLQVEELFYEWLNNAVSNSLDENLDLEEGLGSFLGKIGHKIRKVLGMARVASGPVGKEIDPHYHAVDKAKVSVKAPKKAEPKVEKPKADPYKAPVLSTIGKATKTDSSQSSNSPSYLSKKPSEVKPPKQDESANDPGKKLVGQTIEIQSAVKKPVGSKPQKAVGTDLSKGSGRTVKPRDPMDRPIWGEKDEDFSIDMDENEEPMFAESRILTLFRKYR